MYVFISLMVRIKRSYLRDREVEKISDSKESLGLRVDSGGELCPLSCYGLSKRRDRFVLPL